LLRWLAVLTLLVWTGAHVLCRAHCLTSECRDELNSSSCDEATASESHHTDEHAPQPDHKDRSADASCDTLNSALTGNAASPLVTPEFPLLYTLASTALALDLTAIEPAASFSREAQWRDWVFMPGVCLGPAFRSLAPPIPL
jgi:hypothetical protein